MHDKDDVRTRAAEQVDGLLDSVYDQAYRKGVEAADAAYGDSERSTGITAVPNENRGQIAWTCNACGKRVGPHGGLYSFCPRCGRKITAKDLSRLAKPEKEDGHE